ncbi:hypothetical protein DPMN_031034 [Dreissena polymorpha]|uniref:Chitin-binding type-2 domain-containing protein n=1 Tax=Dreissena polymorpha TaxID=45954 RepID=A0A9D4M2A2_DREPO|nr:hypothetical protein DPMN_031034 [Dreissena polymorpha]
MYYNSAICSKYEHDEIRLRLMHGTNCTSFCHCATLASHDDATVTYYWERQNCSAGTQFDSSKGVCNHVGDFVCEGNIALAYLITTSLHP